MISGAVIVALLAMLMWGISDATVKAITNRFDPLTSTIYKFVPHALFLTIFFLISGIRVPSSPQTWLLICVFGVIGAIALYTFVTAISRGAVSIAVAIAHTNVIFTTILVAIFLDELLSLFHYLAISCIVAGIFLITVDWRTLRLIRIKGIGYALATAIGWGIIFAVLKPITQDIGPVAAAFYTDILVVSLLVLAFLFLRKRMPKLTRKESFLMVGSGLSSALAATLTAASFYLGFVSVSMGIIVAAPVVTLLLAYLLLKERIKGLQVAGIFVITAGLVALSIIG